MQGRRQTVCWSKKKRFQVILFSRPIGFQDPSLPFLFALLVPFSRRIELRDD